VPLPEISTPMGIFLAIAFSYDRIIAPRGPF
jgi:hypothetical protein